MIGKQLKVLLIHRFFKPDSPPYAYILDDIRYLLTENGMQVDVLSSQPSYKSVDQKNKMHWKSREQDGAIVYRLPVFQLRNEKVSKLLNFIWFPFLTFWFVLFGRKYNVVTVSTAPPILLSFLIAIVCKLRGFNLIYHCMDIHPEIGRISGEFKMNAVFKILCWMDSYTCRSAAAIIVLSSDMKDSLLRRNNRLIEKIVVINNYDLGLNESNKQSFFDANDGVRRVLFAGNIGRFQNLDSFVWALKNNPPLENFQLLFVGEGAALEGIKRLAKGLEQQIRFISHQPLAVAKQMISEADAAIVSLQKNVVKYAYPSKTLTYLSEGTPVLAMVEKNSELAEFISFNDLGVVIAPDDTAAIYAFFKALSQDELHFDRKHIIDVFEKTFSRDQFNKKYLSLIDGLTEGL